MTQGGGKAGKLARWTIGYYVVTTIIAVAHSCVFVGFVWYKLMQQVSGDQLEVAEDGQETIDKRKDVAVHAVIVDMFNSLVPQNIVDALATDSLLAVLVAAVVIGYVIKPGGALMRAVEEVEVIMMRVITVRIYLAPIGVFFLIMPNLFRLDITEIGLNLGVLIGGTLVGMVLHLFVIIPIISSQSRGGTRMRRGLSALRLGLLRGVRRLRQLRFRLLSDVYWHKEFQSISPSLRCL
jgi:Na+/H+-dicarboxylate symporter